MESSLSSSKKLPVTIIGAGAVGSALALAFNRHGYRIRSVISKYGKSAVRLGKKVGAERTGLLSELDDVSGLVVIAVPDDEIAGFVRLLSRREGDFSRSMIFHTSGALTSDALKPLQKKGATIGSFHPLQTILRSRVGRNDLRNIWIGIEGDAKAVKVGISLAKNIGSHPFILSKKQKVLYHIAAVFSSNYLVTILSVVEQLGHRIGLSHSAILPMFEPLILQSLKNVKERSAAVALTGPVARGDKKTLRKHHIALQQRGLTEISTLYRALERETMRLAQRKKK